MTASSNILNGSGISWTRAGFSSLPGFGLLAFPVNYRSTDRFEKKVEKVVSDTINREAQIGARQEAQMSETEQKEVKALEQNKDQIEQVFAKRKIVDWTTFGISCLLTVVALVALIQLGYISNIYAKIIPSVAAGVWTLGACSRSYYWKQALEDNIRHTPK